MALNLRLTNLLALAVLAIGTQASSKVVVGEWALENFSMTCPGDGHSCDYSFQIIEGVDEDDLNSTECAFTIDSQGVPATLLNFTTQPCDGSDAYRVNGGWDPLGFITLCVSHASEDAWAFFGYESWQVVNTNATWKNVRPAYKMLTFNRTDERVSRARRGARAPGGGPQVVEQPEASYRLPGRPRTRGGEQRSVNDEFVWTVEELKHGMCGEALKPP